MYSFPENPIKIFTTTFLNTRLDFWNSKHFLNIKFGVVNWKKNIHDNINKIHEKTIHSWYTFEKPKEIFFILFFYEIGFEKLR